MELNHLRYFYEVAKAGSFTSASLSLRVSQPSLSKAVSLLEARENVKLLERSKKGVSLTPLGEAVFEDCKKIFQTLKRVENRCQRATQICQGPLRIAASDHIANYHLAHSLVKLNQSYPEIRPQVFVASPADSMKAVQKNEVEFALSFTKIEAPNIVFKKLKIFPLALVYSSKLNKKKLKGYIGSFVRDYKIYPASKILSDLSKYPEIIFESNSQELQKRICLEGGGLSTLIRYMVEKELQEGTLKEVPLKKTSSVQLILAHKKNHLFSLGAETFIKSYLM